MSGQAAAEAELEQSQDELEQLKLRFKAAFNKKVFGIAHDGAPLDPTGMSQSKDRSKELTQQEWLGHIDICNKWNQEDVTQRKAFRKENHNGYKIVSKYVTEKITLASGEE